MGPAPAPRYAPARPLPPYAYLPGAGHPHPRRHPGGHSYGPAEAAVPPLDPLRPFASEAFLAGVDLYNAGFHWEAHEVLEALWHAAGRRGPVAELLQGLIKLAAAGVKLRQGRLAGVVKHARRAAEHLERVQRQAGGPAWAGLDLGWLAVEAQRLQAEAEQAGQPGSGSQVILPLWRLSEAPTERRPR